MCTGKELLDHPETAAFFIRGNNSPTRKETIIQTQSQVSEAVLFQYLLLDAAFFFFLMQRAWASKCHFIFCRQRQGCVENGMRSLTGPSNVTVEEYITDRFLCSRGSSGQTDAFSCRGVNSACKLYKIQYPGWRRLQSVFPPSCRRLWRLPLSTEEEALLSGWWLLLVLFFFFFFLSKPCQVLSHGQPTLVFFCYPGWSPQLGSRRRMSAKGKSAFLRPGLPHWPVPDSTMAEAAPA